MGSGGKISSRPNPIRQLPEGFLGGRLDPTRSLSVGILERGRMLARWSARERTEIVSQQRKTAVFLGIFAV